LLFRNALIGALVRVTRANSGQQNAFRCGGHAAFGQPPLREGIARQDAILHRFDERNQAAVYEMQVTDRLIGPINHVTRRRICHAGSASA
jgi:hypothetical protein